MAQHTCRFVKEKNGFLLLEVLLAVVLFLILSGFPLWGQTKTLEKQQLDCFVREFVLDLQDVRLHASGNGNQTKKIWTLSVRPNEYLVLAGSDVWKRRPYQGEVRPVIGKTRKDFYFDDQGRPQGKYMQIQFFSSHGSFKKTVIIAAQTGRIRIQ